MKNILNKKELSIIKATGSNSKSVMALYNSSIGRDRALIRAGMWLQATMSLDYVSEPAITGSQAAIHLAALLIFRRIPYGDS